MRSWPSKAAEWPDNDIYLSFLPLSHVTARHLDYVCYLNAVLIVYCPVFDQLPMMFQEVKPTIIVAVPRVYEKSVRKPSGAPRVD